MLPALYPYRAGAVNQGEAVKSSAILETDVRKAMQKSCVAVSFGVVSREAWDRLADPRTLADAQARAQAFVNSILCPSAAYVLATQNQRFQAVTDAGRRPAPCGLKNASVESKKNDQRRCSTADQSQIRDSAHSEEPALESRI